MADGVEEGARRLAEQHGLRFVDLTQSAIAPGADALLPEALARRHHAVPIGRRLGTPVIAVADPGDLFAMDALRQSVGREFVAVVARPDQVERAMRQLYPSHDAEPDVEVEADASGGVDVADEAEGSSGAFSEHSTLSVAIADEPMTEVDPLPEDTGHRPRSNGNGHGHLQLAEPEMPGATAPFEADEGAEGDEADEHVLADRHESAFGDDDQEYAEPRGASGEVHDEDEGAEPVEQGDVMAEVTPDLLTLADSMELVAEPGEQIDHVPDEIVTMSLEESLREILHAPTREAPQGISAPPGETDDAAEQEDAGSGTDTVAPPPVPEGYGLVQMSEADAEIAQGPPLARVLVEAGRVSAEDMVTAMREHQTTGDSLARYLYNHKMATEEDLVEAMAQEVGLEFVDLNSYLMNPAAAELIPEAVCRHHMVLPINILDGIPIVAMANPTDVFAMDDLRTIMGRSFTPVVATRSQIAMRLRYIRSVDAEVAELADEAGAGAPQGAAGFELESLTAVVEDAPIVRYVNLLILQALNERASDIHIEPTPKRLRIRFRIDGVMHDATSASPSIHEAVISRLKVLGEMDITEHRIPQEGRVSLSVSDRQIDLRLAVLPSMYGETCVMRLLDKTASIRSLPELGFDEKTLVRYAASYQRPYGVILVTGPTGAGKTTTLYATLQEVLTTEKSVVTVEDPVEYQIGTISQVQINKKAGLLFSNALRSILRADPDVVLIGEIRDAETATIAMEAALSGHLVLSTLHTNTAAGTPLRLTEMGIEPFLVTSAVSCILTQRLARNLCTVCKEPYEPTLQAFVAAGYSEQDLEGLDTSTLYHSIGCRTCGGTGYLGRIVLCEVMTMTEEIDRMIIEQETIVNIERKAVEQGMRTLRRDGLQRALEGVTTLEEVLRVVV